MLTNDLTIHVLLFMAGFALLTGGAEFLVRGASRLAVRLNVSSIVVGLTVVAFGTSLPELLVSLIANLRGDGGSHIAIGNIVGSNIANLGLILGMAGLIAAIPVERHLVRREYPLLIGVSVVFIIMAWDGSINRLEGLLLVAGLIAFTYYSYTAVRELPGAEALDVVEAIDPDIGQPSTHVLWDLLLVAGGLGGLILGAQWLVDSAQVLARALGVSELVIGLTLVAVGTSLPELATSIVAVIRKEGDIAVGNVVGSNLFNILFIGGASALVRPLPVPLSMRTADLPAMLGLTLLVYLLIRREPSRLLRWQGALIVAAYLAYTTWLFMANGSTMI
ncbi:MAG: sodium:calcium antiporter [Litorilinea sp.]|nr:MAG: sodium:calcium antiporter [Litorilinea sp.]